MNKFDAATDPTEIDRYQLSVEKALLLITGTIAVAALVVWLGILFARH